MDLEVRLAHLPASARRLPPVFKAKWLKALRSGEYKQGRSFLVDTADKFCCLGVACSVNGMSNDTLRYHSTPFTVSSEAHDNHVPSLLIRGYHPMELVGILALMNDREGYTFKRIADVVERYC